MENWYKQDPDRLKFEIELLKDNGIQVEFNDDLDGFDKEGVVLNCTVPVKNNLGLNLDSDLGLKIIFPSNFPYFRPEVYVTTDIVLPRHQDPISKNLCLIPRPSQYWDVPDSIYNYLKERLPIVLTKGLITDQNIIGMDTGEQAEPVSEYYIDRINAVIFGARPSIENNTLPKDEESFKILDHGFINLSYNKNHGNVNLFDSFIKKERLLSIPHRDSNNLRIVIKEWFDSKDEIIGEFPNKNLLHSSETLKSKWYKINSLPKLLNNENSFDWLIKELEKNDFQRPKRCNIRTKNYAITSIVALLFPEEEVAGKIDWGWAFFVNGQIVKINGEKLKKKYPKNLLLPIMSVDQSDLSDRIPQSESLKDKTISVIGLGSLGAPSVLEFAKNGVAKLKLMDFDIVETTTSVRWPLGIESAGIPKTLALKEFINKNYPNVQVETVHHRIGSVDFLAYPNENEKLNTFLDNSSLVYDASAEEGVSNLISYLCKEKKIPYIAIEGRRGAWGGLVMRVLPETKNGCWMCLQYSLYVDETISSPREDNSGTIQPRGCGDPTFTGSSFDLQNISLAGVRMAISSLSDGNSNGDWDVAVLSMVDGKEQPIAPKWDTYQLEINPKCPLCNAGSLD